MKKNKNFGRRDSFSPRIFTYSELSKISDDNYEVLNRSFDMSAFNPDDNFVLTPVMIHEHAFGEPIEPHLRTLVTKLGSGIPLAYQDITFEQWEHGKKAA